MTEPLTAGEWYVVPYFLCPLLLLLGYLFFTLFEYGHVVCPRSHL